MHFHCVCVSLSSSQISIQTNTMHLLQSNAMQWMLSGWLGKEITAAAAAAGSKYMDLVSKRRNRKRLHLQ